MSEFVTDEIAAALTLTGQAADTEFSLALDLKIRLPGTARALHEGIIDPSRGRLIAEATRILSNDHACQVETRILPAAGTQTTGPLRAAVARAILAVDPEAAARRREEARKDPRVRRWQEDAPNRARCRARMHPPRPTGQFRSSGLTVVISPLARRALIAGW